ncbi:MAG: hypothetical protein M3014_07240, partial [Chloroflexota bacterium]|nr:hypothetical protein [Chloroflexota bacterium]
MYLAELQTTCTKAPCVYFQLTEQQAQTLRAAGWSLDGYATLQVVLWLVSIGVALGISTLIVWRRSYDRMAMLVALML